METIIMFILFVAVVLLLARLIEGTGGSKEDNIPEWKRNNRNFRG